MACLIQVFVGGTSIRLACLNLTLSKSRDKIRLKTLKWISSFLNAFCPPENGPTKNLKEVQNDLMGFINADTILVGHGLENDLRYHGLMFWNSEMNEMSQEVLLFMKFDEDITTNMNDNKLISFHPFLWPSTISRALQLVHSVVLDTSAVFPHYCGLPYRRSLRSLVSSYLKVSIFDKIALRLGNLTLKDRQHRQCVVCLVWPLGLLCLYLRCFNEDWDKMFF